MKKKLLMMMCCLLMIISAGCGNDGEPEMTPEEPNTEETIDYYGTLVPYTPIEEKDLPEWLRELKNEKRMMALKRIFMGTLNNETIYHLNVGTDSSIIGRFYDKEGNPFNFEGDFEEFITQIRNVRCIYYKSFSETKAERQATRALIVHA